MKKVLVVGLVLLTATVFAASDKDKIIGQWKVSSAIKQNGTPATNNLSMVFKFDAKKVVTPLTNLGFNYTLDEKTKTLRYNFGATNVEMIYQFVDDVTLRFVRFTVFLPAKTNSIVGDKGMFKYLELKKN